MIERNNSVAVVLVLGTLAAIWGAIRLVVGKPLPDMIWNRRRSRLDGPDVGSGDDGSHHVSAVNSGEGDGHGENAGDDDGH